MFFALSEEILIKRFKKMGFIFLPDYGLFTARFTPVSQKACHPREVGDPGVWDVYSIFLFLK